MNICILSADDNNNVFPMFASENNHNKGWSHIAPFSRLYLVKL